MKKPDLKTRSQISYYLNLALEGLLTDEEAAQLNQLLEQNDPAQDFYLDLVEMNYALRKLDWTSGGLPVEADSGLEENLWTALAVYEKTAPAVEVEPTEEPAEKKKVSSPAPKVEKRISRMSIVMAITSFAALFLILAYVHLFPRVYPEATAVLLDSTEARWANPAHSLRAGDLIMNTDQTRVLLSGVVKVRSYLGPEVIVEGPAHFEFPEMEKLRLHSGRLYVKVPPNAIGYTVQTPFFSAIDLGTEFGVKVDVDGSGDVHMFSGKASIVSGSRGQTRESRLLNEGGASRILKDGRIRETLLNATAFVREIDSQRRVIWRGEPVDLADIVGGGNGLGTGLRGSAIDPEGAQWYEVSTIYTETWPGRKPSDETYQRISFNSFVDGVFVPNGETGEVIISSAGHVFEEAPPTSGTYWHGVTHWDDSKGRSIVLDGDRFGTPEKTALLMHPNLGITFDLEAIRENYPGRVITEFSAFYGVSDAYPDKKVQPSADFWILVDGQVKFKKLDVKLLQTGRIQIPISQSDLYLTLITTQGRENYSAESQHKGPTYNDWCVWGSPVLRLD